MSERPRLRYCPDPNVIQVVELAVAAIDEARQAMWLSSCTDPDEFNTPEDYAEFRLSDGELQDALAALRKFLGPTEEEAEAEQQDRQTAKEWRKQYEQERQKREAAEAKLAAYREAVKALKGVEK